MDEGPRTTGRYTITGRSRPLRPSSVSLSRASTTFYGIAATGSYVRSNSLRDAPPGGEAFPQPSPSGKGDRRSGGRGASDDRALHNYLPLPLATPLLSLADASQLPRRGSFSPLPPRGRGADAPPGGEAFPQPSPSGKGDRRSGGRGASDDRALHNYRALPPITPLLSLADASQHHFLWYSCHRQLC